MLHVRFTALLFGLLFVLHALKSCSVYAHQGEETVREEIVASVQKEFHVGFGGRKMGGHEVVEIIGSSKNSGENNDAEMISNGEFQDESNTHDQANIGMNKLESKASEFGGLAEGQETPVIGNRAESKMLLEAAKEIVNLIHKDYKGADKRKPPINNHVPRH